MEVNLPPGMEKKLKDFAQESGRGTDDLIEEAVAGYFSELTQLRGMLDSRYDDLASGRVKPIDGERFFEELRRREDKLLNDRSPQ